MFIADLLKEEGVNPSFLTRGHGGAEAEAKKIGAPFLGRVPLALDVRTTSDEGTPIVSSKPDSAEALRFREMATELSAGLGAVQPGASAYPV